MAWKNDPIYRQRTLTLKLSGQCDACGTTHGYSIVNMAARYYPYFGHHMLASKSSEQEATDVCESHHSRS